MKELKGRAAIERAPKSLRTGLLRRKTGKIGIRSTTRAEEELTSGKQPRTRGRREKKVRKSQSLIVFKPLESNPANAERQAPPGRTLPSEIQRKEVALRGTTPFNNANDAKASKKSI